jgi:hypothetical protein
VAVRTSEIGEERVGPSGEPCTAVLGRGRRCGGDEFAGAIDVAVGAAGEAEVGVVELAERSSERCLKPGVDVVREREPFLGVVVVAEQGGGTGERARNRSMDARAWEPGTCAPSVVARRTVRSLQHPE